MSQINGRQHVGLMLSLALAMFMCASAGVAFSHLTNQLNVPASLAASWRLAWVELLQLMPFLVTVRNEIQNKSLDWKRLMVPSFPWMVLSGFCLGLHFTAWVESLLRTSLTHSLLWVSVGPMLLNGASWILFWLGIQHRQQPGWKESFGAAMGVLGSCILLVDVGNNRTSRLDGSTSVAPSWQGDMIALTGAATVTVYLVIGRMLRAWMPLWIYSFIVVGCAYLTSLCLYFLFEYEGSLSIWGFLQPPYLWSALYLGVGPGILGHTLVNALLKFFSPLIVSTAMLSEPVLGSLLGYALGMQGVPGWYTWTGGVVLLLGLFFVLAGDEDDRLQDSTSEEDQVLLDT